MNLFDIPTNREKTLLLSLKESVQSCTFANFALTLYVIAILLIGFEKGYSIWNVLLYIGLIIPISVFNIAFMHYYYEEIKNFEIQSKDLSNINDKEGSGTKVN